MNDNSSMLAYGIAVGASTLLWVVTSMVSGKAEPWDSSIYWTAAYPVAIALAGVLGYLFPHRPRRWALAVMFTQVLVMVTGGAGFGLLPLGLILIAILSLPAVALASWAAGVRRRRERA